ncbi:hypothetical protein RB195_019812 [Necator americanus]
MDLLFFLFREIQSAATLLPILGLFVIRSYLLPAEAASQCIDSDKDCAQWVRNAVDGCDDWLKAQCQLSCSTCRSVTSATLPPMISSQLQYTPSSCDDRNPYCPYWAKTGQCSKNALYMSFACCKECKTVRNQLHVT